MTWSSRANPVKMQLNPSRGNGVTVLGAIGSMMTKPVFAIAKSTNRHAVLDFFMKLNSIVNPNLALPRQKVFIVLDNHRAHWTIQVRDLARQLGFKLLF